MPDATNVMYTLLRRKHQGNNQAQYSRRHDRFEQIIKQPLLLNNINKRIEIKQRFQRQY